MEQKKSRYFVVYDIAAFFLFGSYQSTLILTLRLVTLIIIRLGNTFKNNLTIVYTVCNRLI